MKKDSVVLVDENVIIEAFRTGCWTSLAQYYNLHTVCKVVEETQTGFQNRDPETWIEEAELRNSLAVIAEIDDVQRTAFNMTHNHPLLDDGERDLLIYAESLTGPVWLLNSPDMAAVRFSHENGWTDRLVSLEAMTSHIKVRLKQDLRDNYTKNWLDDKKIKLLLDF